jgi:hypothetical protein
VKYYTSESVVQLRLHKWHKEREKRYETENKIAEIDKSAKKQQRMYAHLMEEFKVAMADPKGTMQKEWDEEQAAHRNGGNW